MDRLGRIDMLRELLDKEPKDIFLNYALALEFVSELSLSDAEQQFAKVFEIDPTYVAAYYQMGKLFESQLKNEEALHYFKTGLAHAISQKNNKAVNEFNEAIFMLED